MTTETIIEKKKQIGRELKEPGKFKVIICNDDVTPMDFVIAMLAAIFKYNESDAVELTLKVHNQGSAVAGVFPYEVAEQKGEDATNMARINGFPLVIKVEPE
jgi:ATP-dependent Clp protease adaptor protein ClpS